MDKCIRIVVFTTLYPNNKQPSHGIFVENRLKALCQDFDIQAVVVAPVPWFPSKRKFFGRFGDYAVVNLYEKRGGIDVYHPRYFTLPFIGRFFNVASLKRAGLKILKKISKNKSEFDLIDAHYLYPDGVAASHIAREMKLPFTVTARGSDVTYFSRHADYKDKIGRMLTSAAKIISVSNTLKTELETSYGPLGHSVVLRNGVDHERFTPRSRHEIRKHYGLNKLTLIFVGHLINRKRPDLFIQSLQQLDTVNGLIVGDGPLEGSLRSLASGLGLEDRLRFMGRIAPDEIPDLMSAADCLVLPSENEGWANVILEALACGTPVVASNAGSAPELLFAEQTGICVHIQKADAYAEAIKRVLEKNINRQDIRRFAEKYGWYETSKGQYAIFKELSDKQIG